MGTGRCIVSADADAAETLVTGPSAGSWGAAEEVLDIQVLRPPLVDPGDRFGDDSLCSSSESHCVVCFSYVHTEDEVKRRQAQGRVVHCVVH